MRDAVASLSSGQATLLRRAGEWSVIVPTPLLSMADDDAPIIQAVLAGDVERYAELVTKYQQPAIRLAFSFLGHYEDARDVSQEAFVSAYRALSRFNRRARFSTWLYRIIVNACKDAHRRRARQPAVVATVGAAADDGHDESLFVVEVPDRAAGPGEHSAARELGQQATRAIRALPGRQRAAFLLRHVHDCSLEETAAVMGCRVGTVKAHLFRATASLRKQLAPWLTKE